jgi:putative ABC transporter-associated repeat protein
VNRRIPLIFLTALLLGLALVPAAGARVVLSTGHTDVGSAVVDNGKLRFLVKDDTGPRLAWRDPADVVIKVNSKAATRLPAGMGFVGREGKRVWMIPQVQRRGVIWAGWNTEEVSSREVKGGVNWILRRVSGPGRVVVFQTGSFGEHDVIFHTDRPWPQALGIRPGVHAHGNWAFTAKGTYKLTFSMTARTEAGKPMRDSGTLTFKVG